MITLKMNHDKLKEKMCEPADWNINELVVFCITYGYVDDIKKMFNDYPDYEYNYTNFLIHLCTRNKVKTKVFKLFESHIDWKKFHTLTLDDGYNTLKYIAYLLVGDGNESLTKKSLMKKILSKCTITDEMWWELSTTTMRIEDFVVKFQEHIIIKDDKYYNGVDFVDNVDDAKVYETFYHADKQNKKLKKNYYNKVIPIRKG